MKPCILLSILYNNTVNTFSIDLLKLYSYPGDHKTEIFEIYKKILSNNK